MSCVVFFFERKLKKDAFDQAIVFPGRSILNVLVGDLESQGFFFQPTWRVCQPANQHQPTDVWLFAMVQASFPTLLNPATDRLVDTAECIKEHSELVELVKIFWMPSRGFKRLQKPWLKTRFHTFAPVPSEGWACNNFIGYLVMLKLLFLGSRSGC